MFITKTIFFKNPDNAIIKIQNETYINIKL